MDTTDTTGEHHDSHHTHSKQFVSCFCRCESFILRQEQTCWRIFRYIGELEAKSQFIAQDCSREKLATRMPTWTITQYFHQNIKLEAIPGGKTCVSEILQESTERRHEHQAPGDWTQLEHQAPGDWMLQKVLQLKRKCIFIQILLETNTSGSSTILQRNFKPQNEEEHELTIKC